MVSSRAYKEAREHFGLKKGDGLCLHHVDQTLRHTNRERYEEWRPEDLVVMTKEEHNRLHHKGVSKVPWNKGKKLPPRSEEHRKKLSKSHKDQIPWNKGKKLPPFSEEHRKKLSEVQKLPVEQYTLSGQLVKVWESALQAEQEGGFDKSTIARVCKGKYSQHKNYIWKYVNK